ncbi:hypothetical protein IG631_06128 [Alternaria alternata]|nr:hypothetical protein IG631_06128 [Alternaria alternata]
MCDLARPYNGRFAIVWSVVPCCTPDSQGKNQDYRTTTRDPANSRSKMLPMQFLFDSTNRTCPPGWWGRVYRKDGGRIGEANRVSRMCPAASAPEIVNMIISVSLTHNLDLASLQPRSLPVLLPLHATFPSFFSMGKSKSRIERPSVIMCARLSSR